MNGPTRSGPVLHLEETERPYTWGEPQPLGRRQVVRQRTLDPPHVGSNPTAPAIAFIQGSVQKRPLAMGVCLACSDFDVQIADFGFRQ